MCIGGYMVSEIQGVVCKGNKPSHVKLTGSYIQSHYYLLFQIDAHPTRSFPRSASDTIGIY
jgi:hypothetical protein